MRSPSRLDHAGLLLGAAAEGIWSGALAAALTGASGVALIGFATVTVAASSLLARRLAEGRLGTRAARLLAVTLILVAAGALVAGGHGWAQPALLWQVVRGVVYTSGLVILGIHLGRSPQQPDAAVSRALRAFGLLCAVLVCAALYGPVPGWAAGAVVASLVVGGLLVAIVRYGDLTDLVDPAERLPAWPWLMAVLGAVLGVVAVGALLGQVLRVDVVLGGLDVLGGVLRYALEGLAYVIGYAGAGLLRGIAWLLSAIHVHARDPADVPNLAQRPPALPERPEDGLHFPSAVRVIATVGGALVTMGLALALVALALRRFRRGLPADVAVAEERETLASLTSVAVEFAARLGRRLRRRLIPPRRPEPGTPAELVRLRYAELEGRLARAGRARQPGVTVRAHLEAAAAAAALSPEPPPEPPPAAARPPAIPPLSGWAAADLAAIYEAARYSAHGVDASQAKRFEALARAFGA